MICTNCLIPSMSHWYNTIQKRKLPLTPLKITNDGPVVTFYNGWARVAPGSHHLHFGTRGHFQLTNFQLSRRYFYQLRLPWLTIIYMGLGANQSFRSQMAPVSHLLSPQAIALGGKSHYEPLQPKHTEHTSKMVASTKLYQEAKKKPWFPLFKLLGYPTTSFHPHSWLNHINVKKIKRNYQRDYRSGLRSAAV